MTDVKKVIALNRLRAQMLDEEVSPAQKQYYLELAQWLEKSEYTDCRGGNGIH